MTGGIEETYDLKDVPNKQTFFDVLGNALAHDAMMVFNIRIFKKYVVEFISKLTRLTVKGLLNKR